MNPIIPQATLNVLQDTKQWYAQDPTRVDFHVNEYKEEVTSNRCFICRLVSGDPTLPAHNIIAEDDDHIAFFDRFPTWHGYTLVCPKQHLENVFTDLTLVQYQALQTFTYRVGQAIAHVLQPERMYLCSLGSVQLNSHLHFHLVPLPHGVPIEAQQTVAIERNVTGYLDIQPKEREDLADNIRQALYALS